MPVLSYEDFRNALPPSGALLGLDPGSKIIGVAATDPARRLAMPVESLKRTKFTADAQRIFELFDARTCAGLIIGLPRNMDGSEGPRAQSTRAFARNLAPLCPLPLLLWDERLSTQAAEAAMLAADLSRAKRAEKIDHVAAAYILQGALDRLSYMAQSAGGGDG
jgi:putative Holliday junction resolvase